MQLVFNSLPLSVNFITDAPQENCTADRSLLCKTKGSACAIKRESWNSAEAPPQNAIIYIQLVCCTCTMGLQCCEEIFEQWLVRLNLEPMWSSLIKAFESNSVSQSDLACEMKQN